ncbi:MAG: glutathione peroxidase [Bdellovibrionales bacterium]
MTTSPSNFFDFTVKDSKNSDFSFSQLKGKVTLVVNVASKCGFTPQYKGLEALYREFKSQGLNIVGFPCNQFGAQEPGSNEEIQQFCSLNYEVSFPIMAKVNVNGDEAAPVYKWMKKSAPGLLGTEAIKWNFTKFLIGKDGQVVGRYSSQTEPKDLAEDIQKALKT